MASAGLVEVDEVLARRPHLAAGLSFGRRRVYGESFFEEGGDEGGVLLVGGERSLGEIGDEFFVEGRVGFEEDVFVGRRLEAIEGPDVDFLAEVGMLVEEMSKFEEASVGGIGDVALFGTKVDGAFGGTEGLFAQATGAIGGGESGGVEGFEKGDQVANMKAIEIEEARDVQEKGEEFVPGVHAEMMQDRLREGEAEVESGEEAGGRLCESLYEKCGEGGAGMEGESGCGRSRR